MLIGLMMYNISISERLHKIYVHSRIRANGSEEDRTMGHQRHKYGGRTKKWAIDHHKLTFHCF